MGRLAVRLVALLAALLCVSIVAAPVVVGSRAPTPNFHFDLYREGAFVTQYRWTWCVGASTQAMLNIIEGTSDTSLKRQKKLVRYAMRHDEILTTDKGGADAVGFARALTHFGAGAYEPVVSEKFGQAMRQAVKSMSLTGRPAGLLVMGGRHAWTLTGFDTTADPATTDDFRVTAVYVLGPLYPRQQTGFFDRAPDTKFRLTQFRQAFSQFADPVSPEHVGFWVTVSPVLEPPQRSRA